MKGRDRDRGRVAAGTVVVTAAMLLVVLGIMALATLLWPI